MWPFSAIASIQDASRHLVNLELKNEAVPVWLGRISPQITEVHHPVAIKRKIFMNVQAHAKYFEDPIMMPILIAVEIHDDCNVVVRKHLSVCICACLSVHLLFVYLSLQPLYVSVCLMFTCMCLSVHLLFVCTSVCGSGCLLFVCERESACEQPEPPVRTWSRL